MAKKRIHPSLLPQADDDEAAAFGTHPQHGEEYPGDEPVGRAVEDDEDDEDDGDDTAAPSDAYAQQMAEMNRQIGELRAQNEYLQRAIPTAQPRNPDPEPVEEVNWDELLFKNPKEAMRLHGEMVAKQVRNELTADYQRDQSEKRFWTDFYKANGDLTDDHDLVMSVMNKHFNEIGNLPSHVAAEKLADLTRERILRYSNRKVDGPVKKSRAYAEGAAPAKPRAARAPESNITSLSDVIRSRRDKRFKRGRVA